jgi:hypothetical protein
MPLRLRRGTNTQRLGILPAEGELIYTTDTKNLYVGDGTTIGGVSVTTLASGMIGNFSGDVNLNTHSLVGIGDINILGNITASGQISGAYSGSFYANDSSLLIDAETGTIVGPYRNAISNVKITGGTPGQIVTTDGSGNLSFTTIAPQAATNGIPAGGTTGQFLKKSSSTNYESEWSSVSVTAFNNSIIDISTDTITATGGFINFGNNATGMQFNIKANGGQGFNITGSSTGTIGGAFTSPSLKVFSSKGTLASPGILDPGQVIFSQIISGNDGTVSPARSSMLFFMTDNEKTMAANAIPGKIVFLTFKNDATPYALSFNSEGFLGINKLNPTATLDVEGDAKVKGYVQFGSLTSTERNALTAANGMVIYNSSDNRFQGRQNGSWINLDDGTTAA